MQCPIWTYAAPSTETCPDFGVSGWNDSYWLSWREHCSNTVPQSVMRFIRLQTNATELSLDYQTHFSNLWHTLKAGSYIMFRYTSSRTPPPSPGSTQTWTSALSSEVPQPQMSWLWVTSEALVSHSDAVKELAAVRWWRMAYLYRRHLISPPFRGQQY